MEEWYRKFLPCVAASVAGLVGVLLGLWGSMFPAAAQDSRVLQVWPDRNVGVTSGLLEGPAVYTATQVFPLGVSRTSDSDVVFARTYLNFPLDVFPPGAEVLRATLYVYVDSGSGPGEATLGVYRVLDPWQEEGLGYDPAAWPELLASPVASTPADFGALTPILPVSTPAVPKTPTPASTATLTGTETSILFSRPAGHMSLSPAAQSSPTPTSSTSPLATPTITPPTSPLPTPTSATDSSTPTPTSSPGPATAPAATPLPTSTPPLAPAGPALPINQLSETWLTWDVTALVRAWLMGEVPMHGLALASAPAPDADPDIAGDLIVARWVAADDPGTRPYLIAEFEVHPVTPTPTSAHTPVLPPAGGSAGWRTAGLLFLGALLLLLGLSGLGKYRGV